MKRIVLALFIAAFGLAFTAGSFAQEKTDKKEVVKEEKKDVAVAVQVKEGKPVNTICPVSTEELDEPLLISYKDKVYGVCCKSCLKKFTKDPEKYISRLNEKSKAN